MSSMSEQQFCLRWHNYQSSLLASLPQMLDGDDFTDVTLSAAGASVRAHRVVLSACSAYFKELFKRLPPTQHPVIVLPGARFSELRALVTFMYSGEVNVFQAQLPGLLHMADALQVRGLAQVNTQESPTVPEPPSNKRPRHTDTEVNAELPSVHEPAPHKRPVQPTSTLPAATVPSATVPSTTPTVVKDLVDMATDPEHSIYARPGGASAGAEDASLPPATCSVCGKRLSNPYNLRVHMDTHARAAHACASCPHVSRSRDALRKHVSYRHPAPAAAAPAASTQPRPRHKDANNNAETARPQHGNGQ